MKPTSRAAIDAFLVAMKADQEDFAIALIDAVQEVDRAALERVMLERWREMLPQFQAPVKALGAAEAYSDIAASAARVQEGYSEMGSTELAEAFGRFARRLCELAKKRSVEVLAHVMPTPADRSVN